MSNSSNTQQSHVALLPTAGMGHLTPFLRLAASLVNQGCKITLITNHPTVSQAETELLSRFLSAFPQVTEMQVHARAVDPAAAKSNDPFWLQREATSRAFHLLSPFLSSQSRAPFALVSDFILASVVAPIAKELNIRSYMLFTSSAKCFSFVMHYPVLFSEPALDFSGRISVEIPGVGTPIPVSSIAPAFFIRDSMFASMTKAIASNVPIFDGVLINTCHELESETLNALKGRRVADGLPPVFNTMLTPCEFEKGAQGAPLAWLDDQPTKSVVYVSFGSRSAMSRGQIRELCKGLIRSGYRFMWVLKDKPVDREEEESLEEVLGVELACAARDKGYAVKEWVDQGAILAHDAVGGFVSHCGWNSVVEAAFYGVRVLAWPLGGDQRINAEVVEKSGLGMWERRWGWAGEMVVDGEEIGRRIQEMMESEKLRSQASEIGRESKREFQLQEFLHELNKADAIITKHR